MNRDLERDFTAFVESRTPTLFRTAMGLTGDARLSRERRDITW
jgi:hypothetical protein